MEFNFVFCLIRFLKILWRACMAGERLGIHSFTILKIVWCQLIFTVVCLSYLSIVRYRDLPSSWLRSCSCRFIITGVARSLYFVDVLFLATFCLYLVLCLLVLSSSCVVLFAWWLSFTRLAYLVFMYSACVYLYHFCLLRVFKCIISAFISLCQFIINLI